MDKQDVIQAAAQMEKDGRQFYLESAEKSPSTVVRKVLEQLADDELKHLEWIEANLGPHDAGQQARKDAYDRLAHIFKETSEEAKEAGNVMKGDIEPLRLGLDMENKSVVAYARWAEETDDAEVRQLLEALADVERFHAELLENTILYLENPTEYFQKEEGWMLDGG